MFQPLTPLRCLHRAVDLFGSRVGVVSGDREFTYRELGERCERLAGALIALGVEPGDRVGYLSFNTHQLLEGYFGVLQARAIVMPLNVRLSESELTVILNHSGAKILMFESDFAPVVEKMRPRCPAVRSWISIDGRPADAHLADASYEDLLAGARPERADLFDCDERSIAELFYTSGSTGTPKGVMLSHRTVYLHALNLTPMYRDMESMVDLHTIPMYHANGWGRPQASTLHGLKQVMVRRFEPTFVFRMIQEHKATHMCAVPTMANALINAPDRQNWDLSSLREMMIGGAASSPELVERVQKTFPGCTCISGYGLTETSPVIAFSRVKALDCPVPADRVRRQAMAGWPVIGATVRVVDFNLNDVPRDMTTIGEVVAMGDQIMEGYYGEPEATRAVMSGPWLHTGDMAVWDEDGYVQIVDRKKEIIISGGENISSLEVEKAIFAHPAVFECAVVAAPNEKWGEVPVAIVVLKPGMQLTEEALFEFLGARLSKFKHPRSIEFSMDPLPKTGTGKIRKMDLKEKFWAGKERRVQG